MRNVLLIIWGIFAIFYVFFIDTIDESYHMIFKLIPMILVIIIALYSSKKGVSKYYWLIIIGLVFCSIGDYTLQWFIVGLSSFLVGHLFYIAAFLTARERITPMLVKLGLIVFSGVMLLWIAGTLFGRGEMVLAIAVCFYIVVISTMGWTSVRTGAPFAMIGAALFIISDSVLAVNRFITDVPFSHEIIMFTYYGAQVLLALSISQYSVIRNKVVQ